MVVIPKSPEIIDQQQTLLISVLASIELALLEPRDN